MDFALKPAAKRCRKPQAKSTSIYSKIFLRANLFTSFSKDRIYQLLNKARTSSRFLFCDQERRGGSRLRLCERYGGVEFDYRRKRPRRRSSRPCRSRGPRSKCPLRRSSQPCRLRVALNNHTLSENYQFCFELFFDGQSHRQEFDPSAWRLERRVRSQRQATGTSRPSLHCRDGRYRGNRGQTAVRDLNYSVANDP